MINPDYKIDILRHELSIQKKINQELQKQLVASELKNIQLNQYNENTLRISSLMELINNIGHHWRQPLSLISSGATSLAMFKEMKILDDRFFFDTCKKIEIGTQYLSNMIDDFSTFFIKNHSLVKLNLDNSTHSFLKIVKNDIQKHNINIVKNLNSNLEIQAYHDGLIQCFINLFNNAKEILLNNEIDNRYIFITEYIKNSEVVIVFKDNGGGIKETMLKRVFEPYFTTKHKSLGTGLGLTMCYSFILYSMKGTINVQNKKFQYNNRDHYGAEFKITFPVEIKG